MKQLKLSITPCTLKAGTAVSGQPVHVVGKTKPFFIILENIEKGEVIGGGVR